MLKSRIRKLAAAAAFTVIAVTGFTSVTAGGASAATLASAPAPTAPGPLCNYDALCLVDHGHAQLITANYSADLKSSTILSFSDPVTVNGKSAYLFRLNNGDCLNVGGNNRVYDDSCVSGDHNELFWFYAYDSFGDYVLKNVHTGMNLTSTGDGSYLIVTGGPASTSNIWYTNP